MIKVIKCLDAISSNENFLGLAKFQKVKNFKFRRQKTEDFCHNQK